MLAADAQLVLGALGPLLALSGPLRAAVGRMRLVASWWCAACKRWRVHCVLSSAARGGCQEMTPRCSAVPSIRQHALAVRAPTWR